MTNIRSRFDIYTYPIHNAKWHVHFFTYMITHTLISSLIHWLDYKKDCFILSMPFISSHLFYDSFISRHIQNTQSFLSLANKKIWVMCNTHIIIHPSVYSFYLYPLFHNTYMKQIYIHDISMTQSHDTVMMFPCHNRRGCDYYNVLITDQPIRQIKHR